MLDEEKKTNEIDDRATAFNPDQDSRATAFNPAQDSRATATNETSYTQESMDIGGKEIDGYKIEQRISGDASSQSQLYLATKDNKHYAFKLYKPGFDIKPHVLDLLKNNTSPFVIKVYYNGIYNGQFFIVMDYYKNGSVKRHFDRFKALPLNLFKGYVRQLNEGLHYIHVHNVFHWDIKPDNILVSDDFTSLVITDFGSAEYSPNGDPIPKRFSVKKNTEAYVAPEGDNQLSPAVDYYALGVTIMEMAHGAYVKGSLEENESADWFIPKNVPIEIAALVEKLRAFAADRIGYDGVNKWIKNPQIYKISGKHIEPDKLSRYYLNLAGQDIDDIGMATDTGDFVKKLQANWSKARSLFANGVMRYMLKSASDWDGEKDEYFKDLFKKYEKNPDLGLLFLFLKLDPDSEFIYDKKNYHDIETYMRNYLGKNINEFFNYEYLHERVVAEGLPLLAKIEKIHELAHKPEIANKYGSDNYELVAWYNLYSENRIAFIDNKKIVVLNVFTEIDKCLFNSELEPFALPFVFEPEFLETILEKYDYESTEAELKEIWKIKDIFVRNAKLALLLTNEICFSFEGLVIGNMSQFVAFTVKAVESNDKKGMVAIAKLIKSGRLAKWYEQLPGLNDEVFNFLKASVNSTRDDIQLVITFKNKASSGSKSFQFDNRIFNSMQDIFNYLASSSNLILTCKRLMQDKEFLSWLDRMGFTDAKDEILRINRGGK